MLMYSHLLKLIPLVEAARLLFHLVGVSDTYKQCKKESFSIKPCSALDMLRENGLQYTLPRLRLVVILPFKYYIF